MMMMMMIVIVIVMNINHEKDMIVSPANNICRSTWTTCHGWILVLLDSSCATRAISLPRSMFFSMQMKIINYLMLYPAWMSDVMRLNPQVMNHLYIKKNIHKAMHIITNDIEHSSRNLPGVFSTWWSSLGITPWVQRSRALRQCLPSPSAPVWGLWC